VRAQTLADKEKDRGIVDRLDRADDLLTALEAKASADRTGDGDSRENQSEDVVEWKKFLHG